MFAIMPCSDECYLTSSANDVISEQSV